MVSNIIYDLTQIKQHESADNRKGGEHSVLWMDLEYVNETVTANSDESINKKSRVDVFNSLDQLNSLLTQIYATAGSATDSGGTCVLVINQGSLEQLKELACRKTRYRHLH